MFSALWQYCLARLRAGQAWISETTSNSRSARLATMGLQGPAEQDAGADGLHMQQFGGWR
ncbi:MAG: hypothetical protein EKK49_02105 [Rhodocyclaceae bacterium]|nr:MAG: hypothetical protein EKK49_02105 [Rhodocyclaceae bacterium]